MLPFLTVYECYYTTKKLKCQEIFVLNICMVYLDTPVCEWHWQQLNLDNDYSVAVFHVPFPFAEDFQQKIDNALAKFKKIIILCSELHDDTVEFIQNNQDQRIYYFICGMIDSTQTYLWLDWLITTTDIYKNNNLLENINPYHPKPKYFDALLGWPKPHRQIIYNQLKDDERIILTYLQDRTKSLFDLGWITDGDYMIPADVRNTVTPINFNNQMVSLSQIIPFAVYNQTAYSIVAETNYNNNYSFFTEKIIKPMLAKRLFVVFSGQHYLKNLRKLGFQTFDNVIDETYDSIADPIERFNSALAQVDYLLDIPQEVILKKIQPIVDHNHRLLLNKNWYAEFSKNLSDCIKFVK